MKTCQKELDMEKLALGLSLLSVVYLVALQLATRWMFRDALPKRSLVSSKRSGVLKKQVDHSASVFSKDSAPDGHWAT